MKNVANPPKELLVYHRNKSVGSYKDSAINNIVLRVAKRAGIGRRIGNHTLRRTCARMWYRASVPVSNGAQMFDAYFEQVKRENPCPVDNRISRGEPV
jgi:integrase